MGERVVVLELSDRTFEEFFEDEFGVAIYVPAYEDRGTSKRHHLISFCLKEPASFVTLVLRTLADERHQLADNLAPPDDGLEKKFDARIAAIETRTDQPHT